MRVLQMETENFTVCGCVCDVSFVWPDAKCVNDILHICTIHIYPPDSLSGNHGSSWMLSMDRHVSVFSSKKKVATSEIAFACNLHHGNSCLGDSGV